MIVARGLGRGDAQMVVTGMLGGLGRRSATRVLPIPQSGGHREFNRWQMPARTDIRIQQREEDEIALLLVQTLYLTGFFED